MTCTTRGYLHTLGNYNFSNKYKLQKKKKKKKETQQLRLSLNILYQLIQQNTTILDLLHMYI